jgi:hypothetical protein
MIQSASMMTSGTLSGYAPSLITLQFAAFGWRMNREITGRDGDRSIWIPIPDILNIASMFTTVLALIVLPIVTVNYFWLSRLALGIGYVLIAFHPFTVSAHYCLWTKGGTAKYTAEGKSFPYATREETALATVSVLTAVLTGVFIGTH